MDKYLKSIVIQHKTITSAHGKKDAAKHDTSSKKMMDEDDA